MAKITIEIDNNNITINQSATPTKVEKKDKKFFIVTGHYDEQSWVEFVSDNYITAANKLKALKYSCNDYNHSYSLLIQFEDGKILPCNGTDWDIDR